MGGWAALALASCGVGRIDLIDGDVVELSNLNRQVLYTEADLGAPKAVVAANRLAALNSEIDLRPEVRYVDSEASAGRTVAGADFVVDAADWPVQDIGRWINRACVRQGIAHIGASLYPPKMRVGPMFVPAVTGCLECQEDAFRRESPLYEEVVELRRRRPSIGAPFGPACGVLGSMIAEEAAHFLSRVVAPATLGVALTYDLRDGSVERSEIARRDDCPVCSPVTNSRSQPRDLAAAAPALDEGELWPSPQGSPEGRLSQAASDLAHT